MILITGAAGHVGRRTAEWLAGERLRLMVRNSEDAPALKNAEIVRGDFAEPATLYAAFDKITTALVISVSGEPGKRAALHRNAFEAAARAHVGHVVYLSLQGSSPQSKYPYSRDHYVSEQHLAATGVPHTILRDAFYMDMFLNLFDTGGVLRGPANEGRGAFVSREDVARTAAAVLLAQPGGTYDVTGPEALTLAEVAGRLSSLAYRELRYEDESIEASRERHSGIEAEDWQVDLKVGWFEAIAAGELEHTSDTVRHFTGRNPLSLEGYFQAFPNLLQSLRGAQKTSTA